MAAWRGSSQPIANFYFFLTAANPGARTSLTKALIARSPRQPRIGTLTPFEGPLAPDVANLARTSAPQVCHR
jgi:hypothetical protein